MLSSKRLNAFHPNVSLPYVVLQKWLIEVQWIYFIYTIFHFKFLLYIHNQLLVSNGAAGPRGGRGMREAAGTEGSQWMVEPHPPGRPRPHSSYPDRGLVPPAEQVGAEDRGADRRAGRLDISRSKASHSFTVK